MFKKDMYEVILFHDMLMVKCENVWIKDFFDLQSLKTWAIENDISFYRFPLKELLAKETGTLASIVEIWMYKASKGGLFSHLISWQEKLEKHDKNKGKYSHVEINFPTLELCWSSSEVDGGTRYKFIKKDYEKWDFFAVETTDILQIASEIERITPSPYDWLAIAQFLCNWVQDHPNRFVCNEGVHHVMMVDGTWVPLSYIPAPGDIYDVFLVPC